MSRLVVGSRGARGGVAGGAESRKQRVRVAVAVKRPALGVGLECLADKVVGPWVAVHQRDAEPGRGLGGRGRVVVKVPPECAPKARRSGARPRPTAGRGVARAFLSCRLRTVALTCRSRASYHTSPYGSSHVACLPSIRNEHGLSFKKVEPPQRGCGKAGSVSGRNHRQIIGRAPAMLPPHQSRYTTVVLPWYLHAASVCPLASQTSSSPPLSLAAAPPPPAAL
jgi:hypothetical protein